MASKKLALPSGKKVADPKREPDHVSKRGVNWWFAPEWVRATNSSNNTFQRVRAVKRYGGVDIFMVSKDGNMNYVQGSIQTEFKKWCEDREIDCILLGIELDEVILTDWEYVD
jgi:hypothetical protein